MKPSAELHELIRSLTRTERRHFTLTMRKRADGDDTIILKVFEAVAKQKVYDERAIVAQFGEDAFAGNFSAYKSHIVNAVLKSLLQFYDGSTKHSQLMSWIGQAGLLYERGLYDLGYKILMKARKRADELEDLTSLLRICHMERNLVMTRHVLHLTGEDRMTAINRIDTEIDRVIRMLTQMYVIQRVQSQLFDGHLRYEERFSSPEEALVWAEGLMDQAIIPSFESLESFHAKMLWLHAHLTLESQYRSQYGPALQYSLRLVDLFESDPVRLQHQGLPYMRAVASACTTSLWAFDAESTNRMIHKLRHGPEIYDFKRTEVINRFDLQSYLYECNVCAMTLDFSRLDELADEVEDILDRYQHHARPDDEAQLQLVLAELHFLAGKYTEGLEWSKRSIGSKGGLDTELVARTLLCLCYHMLGEPSLAESSAISGLRAYKKSAMEIEPFKTFFRFMRRYASSASDANQKRLREDFLRETDANAARMPSPAKELYLQGTAILWVRAEHTGIPLLTLHRQQTDRVQAMSALD